MRNYIDYDKNPATTQKFHYVADGGKAAGRKGGLANSKDSLSHVERSYAFEHGVVPDDYISRQEIFDIFGNSENGDSILADIDNPQTEKALELANTTKIQIREEYDKNQWWYLNGVYHTHLSPELWNQEQESSETNQGEDIEKRDNYIVNYPSPSLDILEILASNAKIKNSGEKLIDLKDDSARNQGKQSHFHNKRSEIEKYGKQNWFHRISHSFWPEKSNGPTYANVKKMTTRKMRHNWKKTTWELVKQYNG